jgi:hypothetical protein
MSVGVFFVFFSIRLLFNLVVVVVVVVVVVLVVGLPNIFYSFPLLYF